MTSVIVPTGLRPSVVAAASARPVVQVTTAGTSGGGGTGPVGPAGPAGPPGPQGEQGPAGPAGGGTISDIWVWLAAATSPTVGATRIGVDNDDPSLATQVVMHKESKNLNIDYSAAINALVPGDHLYIQARSNAESFHRYSVTGAPYIVGGTTWVIPVLTESGSPSGTEPQNGADVLVGFQHSTSGVNEVWVGPGSPEDPAVELWYDTSSPGVLYVMVDGSWVEIARGGGAAVTNYTHIQSVPSAVWTITHPLGFQPNVTVTDSSGEQVEGEVDYSVGNIVVVTFSAAFAGTAYLS